MAEELVDYVDIPLPTDFHVLRMCISQEMITFELPEGQSHIDITKTTEALRGILLDYGLRHGVSMIELCDCLWVFSRVACSNSPTNTLLQTGPDRGRSTDLRPALASWENATPSQIQSYLDSCGRCPLLETCAHNVPSKRYYKQGIINAADPKTHPNVRLEEPLFEYSIHDQPAPPLHKLDVAEANKSTERRKRLATIQRLAHPALLSLNPDQHLAITDTRVYTKDPDATKPRSPFTDEEVETALGPNPTPEELANIRPYRVPPPQPSLW